MFEGCVSKDKAFYDFCKEHDLAPSSMELIIHSWWRTHDDGSMPDKDFIDKAKYGERVEMSDNDIFYAMSDRFFITDFNYDQTPNGYFDSKEFTDRKEAENYYRELKRMFPIKAIGSYTNSEGKIIITLAKPVITDKLKYKDYQVPTVGSKITLSSGDTCTIKKVEAKNNVEVKIWFDEENKLGVRLYREESNPNTFYIQKKPRYGDSLEQPKKFVSIEGPTQSIYARFEDNKADATTVTPKFKGEMTFAYGNQRAEGVTSTTTLEAIKRGERTATTMYASDGNIDYWKQAKVGDVIEFSGQNGETVLVRVTKELHQLPKSTTAEEWSAKEGWDTSRFEQRVKPQIEKGEAYQMEFEYIDQTSTSIASKRTIQSTPPTINIYAGTGENAHLSNFAKRPFVVDSSMMIKVDGNPLSLFTNDTEFNSVEQAFQAAKIAFAYDGTENAIDDDTAGSFEKRIQQATPAQAKALGRQIPMSKKALDDWNKHKEEVMKVLIKASFEQNPEELKRLLDTGDAILTHVQDRGEWKTLFPKVLMEVREELRGQLDYLSVVVPIKRDLRKIDSLIDTLPKVDRRYFKNLDEVIDFLGTLSNYNPRLKALSDFLKRTKQEGKTVDKIAYDEMMSLLRDTGISMENTIDNLEKTRSLEEKEQKKIDKVKKVYAGTGENAELSNFADRPFQFMGEKVSSVEAAFQAFKFLAMYNYVLKNIQRKYNLDKREDIRNALLNLKLEAYNIRNEILKLNGPSAKDKGRTKLTSKKAEVQIAINEFFLRGGIWDQRKAVVAKRLMKKSFISNPDALKRLLDTGNATLTHTQGRDGWDTLFPRLLTEVREELRQEASTPKAEKTSTPAPNIIVSKEEREQILSEAKRDSKGNLLAPNGNVSNLSEDNYVLVRTKAFKEWFGDWEKANTFNIDAIDTSKVDIEFHDKPWKNDSTKINKTLRIYIKGQHEKGYFELVKDKEFSIYSVHFKTGNADTGKTFGSTKEERNILYEQILNALPDGAELSTWGELSEGGIKALNKIGKNLTKVGERDVKDRKGNDLVIPIFQKGSGVSKVVDENGEPLLVYHGTSAQFDEFRIDVENRTTEEVVYTDPVTAEEFTSDSIGSIFFSDSYGVAAQYGILGNYNQFEHKRNLVQNIIETLAHEGFSKERFKSLDDFINFLESLTEYNPRFINLVKYMRESKEAGRKLTQAEKDAIRSILIDVRQQMKSIESWTFQCAADYLDVLTRDISFLKKYNNSEGIKRLLNGEIPTELTPGISNEPHLTIGYSTGLGDYHALRVDKNGDLTIQTGGKLYKVKDLSEDELNKYMEILARAVKEGIANYNAEVDFARLRNGATVFSSFLNIREPLDHDYEGTRMGGGYKGNESIPFGYIAARQRKRATEQNKDGMIYRNIQDPYLADNYAVFDENQIMIVSKEEPQVEKVDNEIFERLEKEAQESIDKAKKVKTEILEVLGGKKDTNAKAEFDATIATATAGIALETALKGVNPVFNEEEQAQIKEALKATPDGRLRVMSVSRQTDPVFFSKEIVKFLEENSKKPFTDPTRVNVIEVWTKHDGEPIQNILEACKKYKVAPMISFSVTGLGNTALEQGVMKYQDLLDRIEKLVKAGALNPATTTIRIDPILVGETKLEDIKAIVEKAKAIGIKKFVTSLVQSYGYLDGTARDRKVTSGINEALAKEGRTYDWDKYYGRDSRGQINFKPKKEYIEEIGNFLVELNKDPDIEIETCAFPVKGLKNSACLDPLIIERVTGVDVTSSDGKYKRDTSRKDCMCYGAHSDMFRPNEKKCFSSCAYCYAAHSGDNSLNYYNADGTIKDNPYTRVRLNQQQEQQQEMEKKEQELKAKDQEFIDSNVVLNESINKLMTSKVITAAEVNDIAMQIGNQISDEITDILNGKQETLERYKKQLEGIDVTKASRIEIARAIGIKNLIESCKNIFLNAQTTAGLSFKEAMQLALIKDNWDAMLQFADPIFIESEGFSLLGNGEIIEDTDSQSDDINGTNDNEQLQEEIGDSRENWQIEARTRSFMKNASALVKSVLRGCYLLDENGETQTTKFGIKARVELHDAVSSIIRWTQGAQDIDEMLDALNAKVESNPWIKQVIEKLEDRESGKWADFQSQFFTAVCLREQLYSVVKARRDKNTGKITYISIPVNKFPALKNAYSSIENQFKISEHPMFTSKGVNESALLQLEDAYKTLVEESEKANPDKKTIDRMLLFAYHSLGYYAEEKDIAEVTKDKNSTHEILRNLESIIASLKDHKEDENYRPFAYDKDRDSGTLYNSLRGMLRPLTERLEDISVSSFYEGGKMYQTYTTPSYMTNLMSKFHQKDEAKFEKFIKEQYGSSEWFYDKKGDEWYLPWLDKMMNNKEARNVFEHKVQLAFDKKAYMSDMGDLQYVMSIMSEYFNFEVKKGATEAPAWFRVPMLSNKSSSEFIKFYKQVGTRYKSNIVLGMVDIMLQEIARIRTVNTRNLNKGDRGYIKNWDERGKHFNLLTFLDKYMEEKSEFGNLLRKATSKEGLTEEKENIELIKKAKEIIMREMQEKANKILDQYEKDGIIDAASSIENIGNSKEEIRDNIENFIWNDTFAAMNILELTVTDPAYYKDAVDLQKRFAQIHAPGTRPNVKATDYGDPKTGRKPAPVADKWSRTIVINDFKELTSNIIENLEIVFDRKIRESEGATKEMYISMKDRIIKAFKDVNLTDAQAYNSPTSYRKKAILFGRWSREKEDIYQRLMKGDYNITDLEKAFGEVLKPFVYTQTVESVGKEGSPIQNIPVPFQNKNSEYLLIMADAILKGEDTGKPNLLRAIYQVMEDSAKENPTRGIDTVQFDSAIKSGLHDAISLKEFAAKENGEFFAKEHILNSIYKRDASGNRTTEYSESVRLIDWMDYGIQQEVPEHFKNHKQAHGSQIRAIIPSELSLDDAVFTVEGRPLKAGEFAKEYEETIAQNIKESLELLEKKFNIKGNRKERNIALAKILQEELNSSSRYGLDLKQACLLNEDGEFNIALGDPIQSKRIEQLINSVIKNNVNKQEIAGGPVVQVSNFGTSKSLNIRFKDKSDPSGKTLLMTEEEWNNSSNKKEKTFKEYRDNNQGGIAYFECYAPIYLDEEFFNRFADENGNIDISLIEKLDPDLLKMVGYRIPTEDKYSCAPLKIVGFLPREAGEGIMLPAEITSISGSDFDVDKMYVMRKEFKFVENRDKIHKELFESLIKSQDHALKYETKRALRELIDQFLDNPYNKEGLVNQKVAEGYISMTENAYNTLLEAYEKARKKAENTEIIWPKQGRAYRNNKIVDMTYEVLTHEDSVDKILNPGGFEPQKELGYMVADIKGANSVEQNLAFIDTHVQFYKQNSAAASLIGTFAVHKVAHALLERDPLYINFRPASGLKVPMTLGNTVLDGLVKIDPTRDSEQALIGKTLGSLVASAADAAKDPVLNFMNINKDTANILTTAIRLGVPFRHAALLLSQKCMDEILHTLSQRRLKGEAASLQGVIEERLKKLKKEAGMEADGADSALLSEGLAERQLQTGLRSADKKHEIKVLSYVNALLSLNKELKGVTLATRFNSISNATGPLIVDNLIMEEKMKDFSKHIRIYNEKTGEYKKLEDGILDVFALHPILQEFSKGYNMARIIMRDMPLYKESFLYILDAFENLGVESIISNRDNLSKFADYYLSYILVANDVINPGDCSYYINDFPRDFLFREKCKEKYRGNPFIDAIKLTIDSNTGLSSLSIDITGLNNRQKSILMSGFIDLLSKDKEMAIKLFNYNFFRGGLGFTPKTFMSLTPLLLKQSIKGYNESYLNSPTIDPKFIIDLFIRNNWNKSEFVKFFPETHTEQTEDGPIEVLNYSMSENGDIIVSDESLYNRYKKQGYIRMKINGKDKLYKRTAVYKEIKTLTYTEVKPLGGNGAYLEFTDTPIKIKDNLELLDEDTSGNGVRKSDKQGPDDTHDDPHKPPTPELTLSHVLSAFESALKSRDKAHEKLTEFKNKTGEEKKNLESKIKELLRKEFTKLNIPFNEDELNKIYKKMC